MAKNLIIIDVSEHQGKIDWETAKKYISGAIIRTGYGDDSRSQDDMYAVYNMNECERLKIPYATYLYSYANTEVHAKSEVAHEKRMTKGRKTVCHWHDLEERGYVRTWKDAAKLWCEAFGDNAGVYTWQEYFSGTLKDIKCRRWIPRYGYNNGKVNEAFRPTVECEGWQYTSRGVIPGVSGNVDISVWYKDFGKARGKTVKAVRRVVTKKEVAALIMRHLCTHKAHGYTQDMKGRQGTGTETIEIYGKKYTIRSGDRDCSSAVIYSYEAAGISCGGATYTGNMKKCMVRSGNFAWRTMKFTAQMGDNYLRHVDKTGEGHTAMCLSAEPDVLMEFSINEKGTALGGKVGDQKQVGEYDGKYGRGESHLALYYDYPWDGILQCINEEIAFIIEPDGTITEKGVKDDGFTAGGKEVEFVEPGKTDTELALECIYGVHGDGDDRRKALGGRYDEVMKEVNALWGSTSELVSATKRYIKKFGAGRLTG